MTICYHQLASPESDNKDKYYDMYNQQHRLHPCEFTPFIPTQCKIFDDAGFDPVTSSSTSRKFYEHVSRMATNNITWQQSFSNMLELDMDFIPQDCCYNETQQKGLLLNQRLPSSSISDPITPVSPTKDVEYSLGAKMPSLNSENTITDLSQVYMSRDIMSSDAISHTGNSIKGGYLTGRGDYLTKNNANYWRRESRYISLYRSAVYSRRKKRIRNRSSPFSPVSQCVQKTRSLSTSRYLGAITNLSVPSKSQPVINIVPTVNKEYQKKNAARLSTSVHHRQKLSQPSSLSSNKAEIAEAKWFHDQISNFNLPPITGRTSLKVDWKQSPLDLSQENGLNLLHPAEIYLASTLRIAPIKYLENKHKIIKACREKRAHGLPFRKTDAQRVGTTDVNKSSRLHSAFERVGWIDSGL